MTTTSSERTLVDDIWYEPGETYPDLGSIVCYEYTKLQRKYQGLAEDVSKLPTVSAYPQYKNHLGAGSSYLALDTGDLYMYQPTDDTWYKL